MMRAVKMFFKILGYVYIYAFAFVIALIFLPFYGIYALCSGPQPKPKKKKNNSYRSRFEWVAGYLWD